MCLYNNRFRLLLTLISVVILSNCNKVVTHTIFKTSYWIAEHWQIFGIAFDELLNSSILWKDVENRRWHHVNKLLQTMGNHLDNEFLEQRKCMKLYRMCLELKACLVWFCKSLILFYKVIIYKPADLVIDCIKHLCGLWGLGTHFINSLSNS